MKDRRQIVNFSYKVSHAFAVICLYFIVFTVYLIWEMSKFCLHWFHFDGAMCENVLKIHLDYLLSNLIPQCDTKTNHFHKKKSLSWWLRKWLNWNATINQTLVIFFYQFYNINAILVAQKRWFCLYVCVYFRFVFIEKRRCVQQKHKRYSTVKCFTFEALVLNGWHTICMNSIYIYIYELILN